jgi:hypothetical protein
MDGSVREIPAPFPYQYAEGFAIDYNGGLWIWDPVNVTWKNITGGGPGAYEPIIPFGTAAQYWTGQKLWATLVTTVVPEGTNKYYTTARALADVTWTTITGKPATFAPDPEAVDDRVAALLTAGTNITLSYDDTANKLTINSTGGGGAGTVTAVTGTAPVVSSGGNTPAISMPPATTSVSGHLTAADWTTFNGKQAFIVAGSAVQYYRGDKTWANLDKAAVGLGNVDNTSDANKPVSTATQTALNGKEPTIAAGDPAMFWAGDKTWKPVSGGSGGAVEISDAPPATPVDKTFWWESDTGALHLRYNDGNSSQWIQVNGNGLPEAPNDGKSYARKSNAWFDLDATFDLYLPLTGGVISGGVTFNEYVSFNKRFNVNSESGSAYASQANSNYVGLGGTCSFGGNSSTYTIAGYGGYGIYVSGGQNYFSQLTCVSCIFNAATTTSSPTAYLSSGGGLYRSTSQGMFKQAVEDLTPEYADKVLSLRTIFYRPNELTVDPTDWSRFGFLTEDAYETDFRFTSCSPAPKLDENGKPIDIMMELMLPDESGELVARTVPSGEYEMSGHSPPSDVDLKAIVACLVDVVRRQGERIAVLEAASGV